MPESLVEVLAKFHRDIVLPDIERVVQVSEGRLRNEMHGLMDGLAQRMDRLETEYHMTVAGLKRVEERLDRIEGRLGAIEEALQRTAMRSELDSLKTRVSALQKQIQEIEARL